MMHTLNAGSELIVNQIFRGYANEKISRVVCTYEKFSNHYFFDPPLDTATMVSYSGILNALVFLDTNGYFVAEESVTTYCVECFAMGLNLVGRCPSCGSGKIKRGGFSLTSAGSTTLKSFTDRLMVGPARAVRSGCTLRGRIIPMKV